MKYSEAIKMLYKIMKERSEIEMVEFDRKSRTFTVSDRYVAHVCLMSEFEDEESNLSSGK